MAVKGRLPENECKRTYQARRENELEGTLDRVGQLKEYCNTASMEHNRGCRLE